MSIPSGTDTGKSSTVGTFVKWDSRMELFVLPISSYSVWLNSRLCLNTPWLVLRSPYLRHLRETADGVCHASAVKQGLCMPPSVFSLSS